MEFRPIFVDVLPEKDAIGEGELWISHKHRIINLRCPCGCGHLTMLTIHPSRWHVCFDGRSVTIDGSVWTTADCNSHYFIRGNEVIWSNRISPLRREEYAEDERRRMISMTPNAGGLRPSRVRRIWQRAMDWWNRP